MKYTLNKVLYRIIGLIVFIIAWQALTFIVGEQTFILPGPFITIAKAFELLQSTYIYECIYHTMLRMIIGFIISIFLGFIFGTLAGSKQKLEELLKPTMTIFRSIPTATLVYLFLVIAGARITPMLVTILVSFPIIYEAVVGGIKSTPNELLESSKLDSSNYFNTLIRIRIPLAIPYIVVGITSSFALSLKIEIMAEVITGYTRLGLGSAILSAQRNDPTNMLLPFAYSLIAIIVMLIFDLISNYIKDRYQQQLL